MHTERTMIFDDSDHDGIQDDALLTQPTDPTPDPSNTPIDPPEESEPVPEDEVILLVDAANTFNNLSQCSSMLWTVCHCCSKLSHYAFNCYCQTIHLVCRQPCSAVIALLSREGVIRGNLLAMVLYGIALLPLAEMLWQEYGDILHPWYANNVTMQGTCI